MSSLCSPKDRLVVSTREKLLHRTNYDAIDDVSLDGDDKILEPVANVRERLADLLDKHCIGSEVRERKILE